MQVRFTPLLSPYQKSVERRTPPDANGSSMSRVRQSLTRDARIDRINGFLAQDSVRSKMIGLGVDLEPINPLLQSWGSAERVLLRLQGNSKRPD